MNYRRSLLVLIAGILLIVTAFPVFADTAPSVLMIDVQGNKNVATEKVLGEVSNTRIGEPLNPNAVQQDMQKILATGYFANVQANTEKFFNGVKLIFVVVENPIFKELKINGLTKVSPDEVRKQFRQKSGEVFNVTFLREDLSKALKYLQTEKGLLVEPKASTNINISDDGIVQLDLVELRLGKVKISGLQKTKDFVIRRELTLKEGDIIDYNVLKLDYMRIMQLRLFDNLEMNWEKGDTPETLDLTFKVTEAQTGSFNIGASYSQKTSQIGGVLSYSEANLMGLGQSLSVDLNMDEDGNEIQFSFQEPWLDDKHTSFGLSMWNSDALITSTLSRWSDDSTKFGLDDRYALDLIRTGLSLSFGRPWKNSTAKIRFNFEKNEIQNYWNYKTGYDKDDYKDAVDSGNVEANDGSIITDGDLTKLTKHPADFWNNSIDLQLVKNRLNYRDRFFVDGGYQLLGTYSLSNSIMGSEFDYQTILLEGKWFHAITPNLVLGTRLQGAYLHGDYPDYEALYLGGSNKLRGYNDRRFHDDTTPELIGTSYVLSNTELRYRLPANKNLEVVVFCDLGQVNNLTNDSVFKTDYGIGLRYNIPFLGMIRLDQAWTTDGDSRVVFSMGELF